LNTRIHKSGKISFRPNVPIFYLLGLKSGLYAKLNVSDPGHGIDASIMDRIFDLFFTAKRPKKGTGLGFSVVYGIIKNQCGAIDVLSEPGYETPQQEGRRKSDKGSFIRYNRAMRYFSLVIRCFTSH
jgi:signal transduction histidine kinase